MKKNYIKLFTFIALSAIVFRAQAGDPVADMMRSGFTDMQKLANLELAPVGNSLASGLGGGWYNTAKTHKLLGIDLTISVNMAIIPDADKTFDFNKQGFQALTLQNPNGPSTVPTLIAYDNVTGPQMLLNTKAQPVTMPLPTSITSDPLKLAAIKNLPLPSGATFSGNNIVYNAPATIIGNPIQLKGFVPSAIPFVAFPTPTAQLGIGLVFGTDLIVRYMPSLKISGNGIGLWGVAIKHDIKQWIPIVSDIPFFDLSALVGYTKLTFTRDLSVTPALFGDASTIMDYSSPSSWAGQQMALNATALTGQIIISKGLLLNIFTPYIGIGFTSTNFDVSMNGKYPLLKSAIGYVDPFVINYNSTNPAASTITANSDFSKFVVDDKIKNTDYMQPGKIVNSSVFMPNATIGLRLKLLILTIHAQYTIQKYSMVSAGFGFAFR